MLELPHFSDFLSRALAGDVRQYQINVLANDKVNIADATTKCVINGPFGEGYFLLVSGPGNPELVARAVWNIHEIRSRLPNELAGNILAPITSGDVNGLTCALWPLHHPFHTSHKLLVALRKLRYGKAFLDWAHDVCAYTLSGTLTSEEIELGFLRPLRKILSNPAFPSRMHEHAGYAIGRIESGSWRPIHCVQHGDLWMGNFLLPRKGASPINFYVIDWAGATIQGFPTFDLVRLAISLRTNPNVAKSCMDRMSKTISCEYEDTISYTLSAVGELGTRLEHFPIARYHEMSVKVFDFVAGMRSRK